MVKRYFLVVLVSIGFSSQTIKGQTKTSQAVFVEVKGSGINLTLNYDARFSKQINGIGGRIGFGYFGGKYQNAINIPIEANYLLGKGNNFCEIGMGAVWSEYNVESDDQSGLAKVYLTELQGWAFTVITGYRYQHAGRILFRINFTPVFSEEKIYPLAGFSLGYSL
jgi:hypothetical protein